MCIYLVKEEIEGDVRHVGGYQFFLGYFTDLLLEIHLQCWRFDLSDSYLRILINKSNDPLDSIQMLLSKFAPIMQANLLKPRDHPICHIPCVFLQYHLEHLKTI